MALALGSAFTAGAWGAPAAPPALRGPGGAQGRIAAPAEEGAAACSTALPLCLAVASAAAVAVRSGRKTAQRGATARAASRRDVVAAGAALAAAGTPAAQAATYPVEGPATIMKQKAHGTTEQMVQEKLRWNVDRRTADKICSFNRHFAEYAGYFQETSFLKEVKRDGETTYYDSVTGKPLFIAPRGRTFEAFVKESNVHGWPSFRDEEVVWENVRTLSDGECVSVDGTHLGHNIPDGKNRYCINLVSVSGNPV